MILGKHSQKLQKNAYYRRETEETLMKSSGTHCQGSFCWPTGM